MLKLDHLEEAVAKAAFLKEFCFGVRIIRLEDGAELYSSIPLSGEDFSHRRVSIEGNTTSQFSGSQSERSYFFGKNHEAYEITSVPVLIGDQRCSLEMIQPHSRVISTITGQSGDMLDTERYLSGTIGNLVLKDTLTGLFNRRYIDEYLPAALGAAYDQGQPLSVIFADIDQFKQVNDKHGHLAGDLVLQHVAQLLQKKIRRTDSWVARYGGDEFVICLPGVDHASAQRIANRLRLAIMSERFPLENGAINLTCSFGVQSVEKNDFQLSALMLLHRADERLYQAKHAGRNTVM
ncbi:MAG TPA: GGDEF domain-containing protein [Clostridia bacterium]|nr:GGDEF domain-containing protein [Clostridia bacterium]